MNAFLGNLPIFDHKSSDWKIHKGKLTQFLKINSVKDENRSGILLCHLTEETYRLVLNLAFPKELEELSFLELVELLDGHFKPKKCSFVDKANFYSASRRAGETIGEWAARLRGLATYCDFGTALETNLRDRFVLGLTAGPERDKLFEQCPATLTLSRAIELAEQVACAKEAKTMLCTSTEAVGIKEEPVYRARFQGQASRVRGADVSARGGGGGGVDATMRHDNNKDRCSVCGMKNHSENKCRFKGYKCQKCGVKGHLKKVCGNQKGSCVYHIDSKEDCNNKQPQDEGCEECHNFNIRYVADKPFLIEIVLGDRSIQMELDSGSSSSVISESLYLRMFSRYQLRNCKVKMCFYNGHKISPLGFFTILAKYNEMQNNIKIFVVKNGGPPLLGRDFMSAFNLIITTDIKSIKCSESTDNYSNVRELLLGKFPDLWRDELGSFNKFNVRLQLKENSVPKFFKPRTVPFALKDKVEQELERLEKLGILVAIDHAPYATPIVPVLKENGTVRIAGDFSVTLNKDLVIEKYPLPRIEEVFAKLGGGEMYSKLDLKNAYNQFILDEPSQILTAINTHKGLYKYTRLVYGLANAPAIFQKSMETLLTGIDGVSVWLDDICITGPDMSTHVKRLTEVLSRLNNAGLRLQKEKCEFFKQSVLYLGYVISKSGLMTSPDKIKAIIGAPEPTNVTEVKRFLGVVNYYRNFIPNASSLLSPLHDLLRSNAPWEWGNRQRQAMAAVRRELASERVLAHFEPAAQLVLTVDAGPDGLGAVLSQRGKDDAHERPLAYASRSLTASERNYSQIQKEATAIIFGVKRFHQYLYGRSEPFILKTDHRPLVSIFNNKTGIPVTTALRLQRYAIILSAYNYVVQYVSGGNNLVADYFSRAPLKCSYKSEKVDDNVDLFYALKFLNEASPATTIREITQATERDTVIQTVIRYMQKGWPRKITCKNILPFFQCKSDLQYENGCLFRGHRIVIPSSLKDNMLRELHDTHLGITKTKSNARSRMWWPGIDGDIERWIGSCVTCVSVRPAPPRDPPAPWPAAGAPWQRVHIDYMTVGQRVYLVVVDSFSKWVECIFMNNGTATNALIAKLKGLFSTFGIPNVLVSDNDVKINSVEFKTFCNSNGIKYMTSPIYHPPSNGQAENSVRTCKKMLKCILKDNLPLFKINELLLGYLFNYRNTVHCTTGETPAKLMFGRNLRSRLDLVVPSKIITSADTSAERGKRHFVIGDVVWTRWYSARKESWQLGIIKQRIGNKMYNIFIKDLDLHCIRHVDQIMKYTGNYDTISTYAGDVVSHQFSSPEKATTSAGICEVPVALGDESVINEGDGEEWGDGEVIESEGMAADNEATLPPVGQGKTFVSEGNQSPSAIVQNADLPSASSPTPARSRRTNRKIIDYKKYF